MPTPKRRVGGYVTDRWFRTVKDGDTEKQVPSKAHGCKSRYAARYVDGEGQDHQKVFELKREAEAWLRDRLSAVHTGSHLDPRAGVVTVADVHVVWSAAQGHIARTTAATRRVTWTVHVEPRWGKVSVSDVRKTAVKSWVAKMVKDGVSVPTIENSFQVLRAVMATAVDDRRVLTNPCDGVRLPKRQHKDRGYLTHEQVAALAAAVRRDPEVVRFLSYTGLRWGEMAALRVQDFNMLTRRVSITRSVVEVDGALDWRTPKDWERRSVPFPASLADELAALMVGKRRADLVFTDTRGNVIRNNNWRTRVFNRAVAKCQADALNARAKEVQTGEPTTPEFPTVTPHDLRHTAASLSISAGANVLGVQRMLGHKDASMTLNTYADLFDSDLDAVAGALDTAIKASAESVRNLDAADA